MIKVRLFAGDESDEHNLRDTLQDKLDAWLQENPHTEIVNCHVSLACDSGDSSLYGIMTLVYRAPEIPEED